jgi:hypothetical protein
MSLRKWYHHNIKEKAMTIRQTKQLTIDLGASGSTEAINLSELRGFSIQALISGGGSPVGDLFIEVSNDLTNEADEVLNWDALPSTVTAITGVPAEGASAPWELTVCNFKWARLTWDRTSGTGALTGNFVGKD